ncbi:L,D-transpeptidase family protein [soil metagenome]
MKKLIAVCSVFLFAFPALAQTKQAEPAAVKVPFAESLQAVFVRTPDWSATAGTAQIFERSGPRDSWKAVGDQFSVVVGRNGLGWAIESAPEKATAFKKEGDGKAPAGMFLLTYAFGVSEKPEQLTFGYQKLERHTECVDDPASSHYNKIVDRMKVGNFDWKSSEKMLEVGAEYSLGVFVAYNTFPVRSGNGSCIFLHVWKDPATPTSGCTAMDRRDLERIVSRLNPAKNPYLVQLPAAEYKKYRKSWNLPKMK